MPRLPKALVQLCVCASMAVQLCLAQEPAQEQVKRDHAEERAVYHRSGRTAKGENAADLLHRGYVQKMAKREALRQKQASLSSSSAKRLRETGRAVPESGTPTFANLIWQSLGPSPAVFDPTNLSSYGNVTGRVTAVAVDQSDTTGNTVYVGGASGGVWKSTNAAASDPNTVAWTPLTDDQASLAVGAIALQPGGNVLLVGTGETNGSGDSYYGQGILRSTNGGQTWTLISSANNGARPLRGLGFSRIAFSTTNTNLVVAAAASTNGTDNGAETQGADGRGLYYSTDAGATWTYASVLDPAGATQAGSVGDVVYNPAHGKFYAAVRFHGYYTSTDGATWNRLANQPAGINSGVCPNSPTDTLNCPLARGALGVREDTGEVFTIYVNSASVNGGVYVLQSDGGTWSAMGRAGIDGCGDAGSAGCGTEQGKYNLYMSAVPNGANTDLYVGAVNIYKCARSASNPLCTNNGSWLNLTHVYGCTPFGAPAHVHPDQHGIDFAKTSSPKHIYFGNDGGVWRALDETALTSTSCNVSNPFDNLNATLGSLSEFVSFAQHPSDPGIILGGLQDNGSPALVPGNAGTNGTTWQGVNDSDGGYNDIDPGFPQMFYTSIFDVSVQRCASGTSCNQATWSSIVTSGTVSGDGALFYPPWQLDPQNSARLAIGTCRVWRGASAGGGYVPLSNNFTAGFNTPCAGDSADGDTKVRAIALGGPVTGNGSQVVYAGLAGAAPLNGHVFATTNADGGAATWTDRTANINPSGYDVADIVLSPYDATGQTAYLAIMGFGTAHIFKTTNAGLSWTDKTGDLPDVPANTVLVDPLTPNTLYVGTDVGVFVSTDDGATWAELGTGLPNAPAIKLRAFVSGNVKKLRVATYGRGLWQVDLPQPDIDFFSAPLQMAAIVGRSSSQVTTLQNNSANPVTLTSITAGGDFNSTSDCPAVLNPGSSCTVTVIFSAHAVGASGGTLTLTSNAPGGARTLQLNGTGIDFSVSALGPRPTRPVRSAAELTGDVLRIVRGQSATLTLSVSATDARAVGELPTADRTAKLECFGAGLQCSIEPAIVDLANASTVRVTVSLAEPSRSKRLAQREAETLRLHVRALVGGAERVVQVPVQVIVNAQ